MILNKFSLLFLIIFFIKGIETCEVDNCKKCSDDKCIKCYPGYLLLNDTCYHQSNLLNIQAKCNQRNCHSCSEKEQCKSCSEGYTLNKTDFKCYYENCSLYGSCKYCSEFDCLECESGYEINYGYCEVSKSVRVKLILSVSIIGALIIIIGITGSYCLKHNKGNDIEKTISATEVKQKHIPSGQYIIVSPRQNNLSFDLTVNSKIIVTETPINPSSISVIDRNQSIDKCVICNGKEITSFANCGCGLCKEHSKLKYQEDKYERCSKHQTIITESFVIKKAKKQHMELDFLRHICPICKMSPGTNSFNCGCPVFLCNHCFNDNMNVFKYKICPGCNNPFAPYKKK